MALNLAKYKFLLASGSPRRHELLKALQIPFEVILKDVNEDYPQHIRAQEVPKFLAQKKAEAYDPPLQEQILISADTVVLLNNQILGKPVDAENAAWMIEQLAGNTHEVITGVCIRSREKLIVFSDTTEVQFGPIGPADIRYYIEQFKPFDKAGSYGIQDWIGLAFIRTIRGSYTNVMGLPTELLYRQLEGFCP